MACQQQHCPAGPSGSACVRAGSHVHTVPRICRAQGVGRSAKLVGIWRSGLVAAGQLGGSRHSTHALEWLLQPPRPSCRPAAVRPGHASPHRSVIGPTLPAGQARCDQLSPSTDCGGGLGRLGGLAPCQIHQIVARGPRSTYSVPARARNCELATGDIASFSCPPADYIHAPLGPAAVPQQS